MVGTFDSTSYKSNPLLKPAGTQYNFTQEEIKEIIKCKNNPIYFIETYIKIVHPDQGLIPFKLFDFQKKMIDNYVNNRFCITMAARQVGKTQVMASFFVWFTIFHPDKTCAVLANKAMVAKEILQRYQGSYQHLPKFLQQGVVTFNKSSVELENGSRIFASSTSSDAIRGFSISLLYLDEYAFVKPTVADEFFTSVYPTISSGKETKLIISSTPNGFNHFHKMWNEAEEGINGFVPLLVRWDEHPWRDEKWKQEQIAATSEDKFAQEMCCDFLGGTNTLISGHVLKNLSIKRPISEKDNLRIYKEPVENKNYMIFVDTSEGGGDDYSVATVVDVSQFPMEVVAIYRNDLVSPHILPTIIQQLGYRYNMASVLVETNSTGAEVAKQLRMDLEYEDLIVIEKPKKREYGVRMTKSVKALGCSTLKDLVENQKLLFFDSDMVSEISNFVRKMNTYKADGTHNDDTVMTLVSFAWFTTTDLFINLTDQNFKLQYRQQQQESIENDVLPFGFIENGVDEVDDLIDNDGFDLKSLINSNQWLHEDQQH